MRIKFKCCLIIWVIYFIADVLNSASLVYVNTNSPKGLKRPCHGLITGRASVVVLITGTNLAAKHRIIAVPAPAVISSSLLILFSRVLCLAFASSRG